MACFAILLLAFHLIFGRYFPTANGTLGQDYSRILPDLLDGYFWFKSNGIMTPFWFTPAFCGGQPELADLASVYYSIPQILTLVMNPLRSVYATVLLFASLGFWGFYVLLRTCFGASRDAAILGGALFMFNGFFIHRMLVGHMVYHGVILIPVIAYFLLRPNRGGNFISTVLNATAAAGLVAYCAYSGLLSLLTPVLVAILAIICIHGLLGRIPGDFLVRATLSGVLAAGLSATKLAATVAFLSNFPRSDYALPGINGLWNTIRLLFEAMFLSPEDMANEARPLMTGTRWLLAQHEWEYGVTVVPLLIILVGLGTMLLRQKRPNPGFKPARLVWLLLLGFILALPLAINVYTPEWNVFLKQMPLIKSSSNLLRWFLIYIAVLILFASLAFEQLSISNGWKKALLFASLAVLVVINFMPERDYYQGQSYEPGSIVAAWERMHMNPEQPRIEYISALVDANNRIQVVLGGNDRIANGASQLACYNAVFGYRLEHFSIKELHPGPVMDERNGWLNLKNPACYLYPTENNCSPGDHFSVNQRDAATAFANYKPFPFKLSSAQRYANLATLLSLAVVLMLTATGLMVMISDAIRRRKPDGRRT
jgi:hypothetical protein